MVQARSRLRWSLNDASRRGKDGVSKLFALYVRLIRSFSRNRKGSQSEPWREDRPVCLPLQSSRREYREAGVQERFRPQQWSNYSRVWKSYGSFVYWGVRSRLKSSIQSILRTEIARYHRRTSCSWTFRTFGAVRCVLRIRFEAMRESGTQLQQLAPSELRSQPFLNSPRSRHIYSQLGRMNHWMGRGQEMSRLPISIQLGKHQMLRFLSYSQGRSWYLQGLWIWTVGGESKSRDCSIMTTAD